MPTKRYRYFPIFGVFNLWHTSVSSVHNHEGLSFLHVLWYILIENFDLNLIFFDMLKEDYCNVRKVTAALQVIRVFNRFSLQDASLLQCKKSNCRPTSGRFFNRFSLQDESLLQCKKSDCRPACSHIN